MLARSPDRLKSADLADALGTTAGFVPQVMGPLVRAGWVRSDPGPTGGYRLTADLDELSVLQVDRRDRRADRERPLRRGRRLVRGATAVLAALRLGQGTARAGDVAGIDVGGGRGGPRVTAVDCRRCTAVARDRSLWRAVAVPSEHGGWGLTLEPVLLGLLVGFSWSGMAIGAATFLAFLVRTPLKLALVDRRRGRAAADTSGMADRCWSS